MKLVIASDIHGSALWCERLMAEIEARDPDHVVLLGDLLYHGPKNDLPDGYAPKQIIAMLDSIADKLIAVRGNCEAEADQMMVSFPCFADYRVLDDGGRALFCTHGHIWGPNLENCVNRMPNLRRGDAFLFGHSHIKHLEVRDGITIFNPGSVGIPRDGSHSFGTYEDGVFEHHLLS